MSHPPPPPLPTGYHLYFPPDTPFTDALRDYVAALHRFLVETTPPASVLASHVLYVDAQRLAAADAVDAFLECLTEQPVPTLACLGLAAHRLIADALPDSSALGRAGVSQNSALGGLSQSGPSDDPLAEPVRVRVLNHQPVTPLRGMRSALRGRFVTVRGTVIRVSVVKPLVTVLDFRCDGCGMVSTVPIEDGMFKRPSRCESGECRSRRFTPNRSDARSRDWCKIKLQESNSGDESGRMPRSIECELTDDLVDLCVPGDEVTVSGIVKMAPHKNTAAGAAGFSRKQQTIFTMYVDANSLSNAKHADSGSIDLMQFSENDLHAIQEIAHQPELFKLIVNSVCPAIYGYELVKAGLALSVFGGTQKFVGDQNRIPLRGDCHTLVVGDPGMGKSQMLKAISGMVPRGIYVCANVVTSAGLTVTVVKDQTTKDYALEAGALVLGDQGVCCIDEFDKMTGNHPALLEAMEQQSVSVAKAGIVATLQARTAIIAAANPVGGHYNRGKTVNENLKMSAAILSRFDLIFILLDSPNPGRDRMLSDHVMRLHRGTAAPMEPLPGASGTASGSAAPCTGTWYDRPLIERLRAANRDAVDPIPPQLLRKYVAYCRMYCKPTLSNDAKVVLRDFYLSLRKMYHKGDSVPITTRQLESLIRLAEARARLELRETVTGNDAVDVVELMKESLMDIFSDEHGKVDFRRSTGMSRRKQGLNFIANLHKLSQSTLNSLFTTQELRQLADKWGINAHPFEDFIDNLNNHGFLLKRGVNLYKLMSASTSQSQR